MGSEMCIRDSSNPSNQKSVQRYGRNERSSMEDRIVRYDAPPCACQRHCQLIPTTVMDQPPLGRLPRELPNQIWEFVLYVPGDIVLDLHLISMGWDVRHVPLAITETCRQANRETADLVFNLNTFAIHTCYFGAFDKDGKPGIPKVHGMAVTATLAKMINMIGRRRVDKLSLIHI